MTIHANFIEINYKTCNTIEAYYRKLKNTALAMNETHENEQLSNASEIIEFEKSMDGVEIEEIPTNSNLASDIKQQSGYKDSKKYIKEDCMASDKKRKNNSLQIKKFCSYSYSWNSKSMGYVFIYSQYRLYC